MRHIWHAALVALLAAPCLAGQPDLGVELEVTVGHLCQITVSTEEGGVHQEATTRFQADRLDTEGRYIHGVEEGLIEGVSVEGDVRDGRVGGGKATTGRSARRNRPMPERRSSPSRRPSVWIR
jgi:hypothetical protein